MTKLGQHFLTSKKAVSDIVSSADIKPGEKVLEIGPGKGVLTQALLQSGAEVLAVEKDESLVEYLNQKFQDEIDKEKLRIIESDIRDFNPAKYDLHHGEYKLVANIPYYITGELLRSFLSGDSQPKTLVFLVQKEVAKRVASKGEGESILSLSVKAYGDPKYIGKVPARFFKPSPKVDSAILRVENISKNFFDDLNEDWFFKIVKTGFKHKRKMLIKNLKDIESKDSLSNIFEKLYIEKNTRAESLNLETWKKLAQALQK